MVTVAGILMFAVALFAVAYPIFRPPIPSSPPVGDPPDESLEEVLTRRDATYATLRELDLDLEMGKLSETDHRILRDRYRAEAVAILQEIDARQAESLIQAVEERKPEQEIEREVAARRQRQRDSDRCPGCGAAFAFGDRFCRRCGTALGKAGT